MSPRIALITGAARGIGAAIARRLAKDGFDVTINDLPSKFSELESLQKEISSTGRRVYIHTGDVSDAGEVENMVDSTVKTLGGLDVMVANAGIGWVSPLTECTENIWDRIMGVNARGVFLCYKYAAKAMIAQGRGGRIIGASSVLGKQATELRSAYCASKFAVRGLTQSAAQELGKHGITVNAYAPGPIDTPLMGAPNAISDCAILTLLIDDELGLDEAAKAAYIAKDIKGTVVGRIGEPDEVASLVSYLASKESGFMTGQTVSINGGYFFD